MQSIKLYQVDAFTTMPFGGNPAAVCPLETWPSDQLLQSIAQENNLSETAFLVPAKDAYEIRWFAPQSEVELCGHATLAAATVIFRFLRPDLTAIDLHSPLYKLRVIKKNDGYVLDFPQFVYNELSLADCPAKLRCEGLQAVYEGNETLVLRLDSEENVRAYQADYVYLKKERVFLSVTGPGRNSDFVSRYFAPAIGIDEDPVTGSVHCLLAPIWSKILGKQQLEAVQVSRRQGKLGLKLIKSRVEIFGQSVCVMQGEIFPEGI